MNVKIKLSVNTQDADQLEALNNLLITIGGGTSEQKVRKTSTKKKVAKEHPAKEQPTKEQPTKEEDEAIAIEDVRAQLAKAVKVDRTAVKDKLKKLGAPNVTQLDPKHYSEFMDFMKALK